MAKYTFKTFREKDAADAFKLRYEIFVEEQNIPSHLDREPNDTISHHLVVYLDQKPVATGRLTVKGKTGVLSRIAIIKSERGKGLGVEIVQELEKIGLESNVESFSLRPHVYLKKFYEGLGYKTTSNEIINVEGVELLEMEKSLT